MLAGTNGINMMNSCIRDNIDKDADTVAVIADAVELGDDYIEKATKNSIEFKDESKLQQIRVQQEFSLHRESQRKKKQLVEAAREKYNHIHKILANLVMNNVDLIEAKKELHRLEDEYDNNDLMFKLNIGETNKKESTTSTLSDKELGMYLKEDCLTNNVHTQVDLNAISKNCRTYELCNNGKTGIIKRKI